MPDDVEVRPARPDDVEPIRRVARRAWHAAHEPIVGAAVVEDFLTEHYDTEAVRARVERDAAIQLVASAPGEAVVGLLTVGPDGDESALFHLTQCYVDPDRWGRGIGRQLLGRAEDAVRARDGDRIRLGVMAENRRAIDFYEVAGYRRVDSFVDDRLDTDGYTYETSLE